MVVCVCLHVLRVYFTGAYKRPRELTWLTGVVLLLVVAGFGFTGYLLPWDQKAFFATRVGVNIAGKAPVLGPQLREVLVGGADLGGPTLIRFYVLHVLVMPGALALALLLHLWLIQRHGIAPPGRHVDDPGEPGPAYHPHHTWKEVVVSLAVAGALFWLAAKEGAPLEAEASGADKAYDPRPDWYFLWLFQLLKVFEGRLEILGTFVIPNLMLLGFLALPFLDRNPERRPGRRPVAVAIGLVLVAAIAGLTVLGLMDKPRHFATPPHPLGALPEVRRGYDVARREGCFGCHTVAGRFGETKAGSPDLTEIERPPADLITLLADPKKRLATEDMPAFRHLSEADRLAVGHYLAAIRAPVPRYPLPPPAPAHERGRQLAVSAGCFSCHALKDKDQVIAGRTAHEAPSFEGISQTADGVAAILESPEQAINSVVMPSYPHLSADERAAIGRYLEALSK
jgi:ubiquinol-cytochrome c reductase cytochrome b subunit